MSRPRIVAIEARLVDSFEWVSIAPGRNALARVGSWIERSTGSFRICVRTESLE